MKSREAIIIEEQISTLIDLLGDTNPECKDETRALAKVSLLSFGEKTFSYLEKAIREAIAEMEKRQEKLEYAKEEQEKERLKGEYYIIPRIPYESYKFLSESQEARLRSAVDILGTYGDLAAIPLFKRLLNYDEALYALSKIGNSEALEILLQNIPNMKIWEENKRYPNVFSNEESDVVKTVKSIFGDISDFPLDRLLQLASQDGLNRPKYLIIFTLLAKEKEVPKLIDLALEDDERVCKSAVDRLRDLKAVKAVPRMLEQAKAICKGGRESSIVEEPGYKGETIEGKIGRFVLENGGVEDWIELYFWINKKKLLGGEFNEDLWNAMLSFKDNAIILLKKRIDGGDDKEQILALQLIKELKQGKMDTGIRESSGTEWI